MSAWKWLETAEDMINEGLRLYRKFGHAATIKVPCTVDGLVACKTLADC